jgi:AcrR family transcriptional regulator
MSELDAHDRTHVARGGRPRDPALDEAIIVATRRRLAEDGYSRMSLGDIAADAGVTRPTIYRRWPGKFELVVEALDWGFRAQRDSYPTATVRHLGPREAFVEAIRRLDPCYFNPDGMILMGNFMSEARRTPELLEIVSQHAVEPRVDLIENVLRELAEGRHVKPNLDARTLATMCFGAYFAAFLRGDESATLAERVCETLWPMIRTQAD